MGTNRENSTARLLVISDHVITRIGLESCLGNLRQTTCTHTATVRDALQRIKRLRPNLIVLDVSSPSANHLSHIQDLHSLFPEVPILAFSNQAEPLYAERVLRLGAKGYVSEQLGPAQLTLAAKRLLAGHVFVPEEAAEKMLSGLSASPKNAARSPLHLLSERELQVFEMIGEGKTIPDVSRELAISRKTVDTHRSHIRQKLSARNAYDLLTIAFRWVQAQKA